MIRRIQSIYLLLTTLFAVLFLGGNIIKLTDDSGNLLSITLGGLKRIAGESPDENLEKLLPLVMSFLLIAVLSVVTLFLYRNRKLQMRFALGLFILTIMLIIVTALFAFFVMQNYNADILWEIKMILPLLMALCSFLAYRGIKKDDNLVKSYDRLR